MAVKIKKSSGEIFEVELVVTSPDEGRPGFHVWLKTASGTEHIGVVRKDTYSYSPPTHKGSRVAKYHRQVACWKNGEDTRDFQTRKAAILNLIGRMP